MERSDQFIQFSIVTGKQTLIEFICSYSIVEYRKFMPLISDRGLLHKETE